MSYAYATSNEKAMSGALALAMHLAFFVLMVLGVTWQHKRPDSAVVVDLWSALPPVAHPKPEPPAPEPPKPASEPPKPAPEPPKPAPLPPKPEPKPAPKPDIELQAKLEKERREKERLAAEEKRRAEEKKRAEAKQREEEKRQEEAKKREEQEKERKRLAALKEQQAKEMAAREQREALEALARERASAQQREIDKYKGLIRDRIRRFIVEPPNLQGNPEVEFDVVVLPGGEVLSVRLKKSSGFVTYDNAVERAVLKAQPLPLPPDASLHKDFRDLNLKFRPKE